MSQSRGAPWFPIQMIYQLVAWVGPMDQDPMTPITRSGYIPYVIGSANKGMTKEHRRHFRKWS